MIATAFAVAFVVFSCKSKISKTDSQVTGDTPLQIVNNMTIIQSKNGKVDMRAIAPLMEKYENDSLTYEIFPRGFSVYAYTKEGLLETQVLADKAKHINYNDGRENWIAYGNVVITNLIKEEVMETDTIYWDQKNERIYTHCYVKMYSPSGFMQGYGMESDQRARNSVIFNPFNSYGIVVQDSTRIDIDSVNFIGPMRKKTMGL